MISFEVKIYFGVDNNISISELSLHEKDRLIKGLTDLETVGFNNEETVIFTKHVQYFTVKELK